MMNNKKLFYGVLVVCLLGAAGISLFFTRETKVPQPAVLEDFIYKIKPCGERKSDSIALSQVGNSIKFVQALNTYCEAEKNLTLQYILSDKKIEIREIFDAQMVAKCICLLGIEGQINKLEKGKYEVRFVFDNRYLDRVETLEETEFELK